MAFCKPFGDSHRVATPQLDPSSRETFMMVLATALHRWGISAHRLEARMTEVAHRLQVESQFFSTPTSLTAGFGPLGQQNVQLVRIDPGSVNLSKLLDLDRVAGAVAGGRMTPTDGLRQVREIDDRPPRYRGLLVAVAFGILAAATSRFFHAGINEIWASAVAGLIAGALAMGMPRLPRLARLYELVASFCVTLWVSALHPLGTPVTPFVVILSGLIVLVPGLTLTVAVSELATQNLVSGTARMTSAGMSLLQMAFGVALGQQVAQHLFGPMAAHTATALPPWTLVVALVLVAVALTILFQAPPSLFPAILIVTGAALAGSRLGGLVLTPQLAASVGALFVGLCGNLYARLRSRPATVLLVPGLLVIVPGSLGFRSVNSLLQHDPTMGIETAFNMGMVAVSIVAGLLVSNVVLTPSRGHDAGSSL